MSGFTYNGTHCSTYNVDYIPDADDRWFAGTDFEVYDKDISWKNGGYYYGNKAKKRVFSIKCYFEEITIKQREDIRKWLHRNTRGSLIFDDKPFVYWNVIPTKLISGKIYNDNGKYSGTFTVEMTAYEPFGYLTRKYNSAGDDDNAEDYCDLIPEGEMPDDPETTDNYFFVYNPGRETCGMTLRLRGTTDNPIMFINIENNTSCVVRDLPSGNLTLDVNGDTGNVIVYQGDMSGANNPGFAYHDRGFVRLNPGLNRINIMEKNSSGGWSGRNTLDLTYIEVDYKPRIL